MTAGGNMANLLGGNNGGNIAANQPPQREVTSVLPSGPAMPCSGPAPPDTSEMSHKERVAAMKAYRTVQENSGAPALHKQYTAGKNDGVSHTTECSIGERPSSRVLAPPGGKSNFTFG